MRRPFGDNGAGVVSYRGWLYSGDSDGNQFGAATDGCMPVRPTPPHALSHPVDDDERPNLSEELVRLTAEERAVWDYQHGRYDPQMVRIKAVPVGELVAMERRGYTAIPGTKQRTVINGNLVETWDVEGKDFTKQGLSYAEIAQRMELTVAQVHRRVVSAHRKLKGK